MEVRSQLPGNIEDIPLEPIPPIPISVPSYWHRAGVYGIYNTQGELQFVAAAHDVGRAIMGHRENVGDDKRVGAVRMMTVDDAESAPLDDLAENWVMSMSQVGQIPPGNSDEAPEWRMAIREGPISDVTFSNGGGAGVESEIKSILRKHPVVVFIKGTKQMPKCGFSKHVLDVLQRTAGDGFVCVDCLDSMKNPGLREGIKQYSSWPTIPQLFVDGDFVGGADIVTEMEGSGELAAVLAGK